MDKEIMEFRPEHSPFEHRISVKVPKANFSAWLEDVLNDGKPPTANVGALACIVKQYPDGEQIVCCPVWPHELSQLGKFPTTQEHETSFIEFTGTFSAKSPHR